MRILSLLFSTFINLELRPTDFVLCCKSHVESVMRGGIQAYINSLPAVPDHVVPAGPVRVPYGGVCSCLSNLGGCYIDAARPPPPSFTCKCVKSKGWFSGKTYACFGVGYKLAHGEEHTGGGHDRDQCLNGAKTGYLSGDCGGYFEEFSETTWDLVSQNVTIRLFAPHSINSSVSECNIWEQGEDIQCKILDKGLNVKTPSMFNPSLPVKMVVHGFADDIRLRTEAVPRYMEKYSGKVNVILVNWASMARVLQFKLDNLDNSFYYRAARNAMIVGEYLGRCLAGASLQTGLQGSNIHIIGHSLGGQMLGTVGRTYTKWLKELKKSKALGGHKVESVLNLLKWSGEVKEKASWILNPLGKKEVGKEKRMLLKLLEWRSKGDEDMSVQDLVEWIEPENRAKVELLVHLLGWSGKEDEEKVLLIQDILRFYGMNEKHKVKGKLLKLVGLNSKEHQGKLKYVMDFLGWSVKDDAKTVKWILDYLGLTGQELKIGRLTALDPAGPGFVDGDVYADPRLHEARLSKDAATFIDVIHSNAGTEPVLLNYHNPLKMRLGDYGPNGHIDFYPDGGDLQQGCNPVGAHSLLRIGCSHERSYQYFIDSINDSPDTCMHGWYKGYKVCMGELAQDEWEYWDGDIDTQIELASTGWYDKHQTGAAQDLQNITRAACKALLNIFREYVDPLLCRDAWPSCLLSTDIR